MAFLYNSYTNQSLEEVGDIRSFSTFSSTLTCAWTLNRFSDLESECDVGYKSRKFHGNLFLEIYPNGTHQDCSGIVTVFLRSDFPGKRISPGKVGLKNSKNEAIVTVYFGSSGYVKLVEHQELLNKLPDDILIVCIEGTFSESNLVVGEYEKHSPVFEIHDKVLDDLEGLLFDTKSSDLIIRVGQSDFSVHKSFLSARSKVFAAMFKNDTLENNTDHVFITDFEVQTIEKFLRFIYCGRLDDMNVDLAFDLLRASEKYDLEDLKSYCSNFLISRLDDNNVRQIFIHADMYNASYLKRVALNYICTEKVRFNSVSDRELFADRQDLLLDIINHLMEIPNSVDFLNY